MKRKISYTAATGTLALLTACGGNDMTGQDGRAGGALGAATSAASPSVVFNDADVMFTQMMIPHHEQAVEMAGLAPSRASDIEVTELAEKIKASQEPEIQTMKGWLTAWNKPEMSSHVGHEMPGLISEEAMEQLRKAKGKKFDKLFARHMIVHHNGAIEMVRTQEAEGADPKVKKVATHMASHQRDEVAQLQTIVDRL
ncbi:DUF305 domain-containing protein [Nonomuraea sp. NPDC050022]|uniref:DUF305 domain-containing protein n=1 Tax=unclassified Nonomuraea TaxID=2593643 RepID=UPI0033E024E6